MITKCQLSNIISLATSSIPRKKHWSLHKLYCTGLLVGQGLNGFFQAYLARMLSQESVFHEGGGRDPKRRGLYMGLSHVGLINRILQQHILCGMFVCSAWTMGCRVHGLLLIPCHLIHAYDFYGLLEISTPWLFLVLKYAAQRTVGISITESHLSLSVAPSPKHKTRSLHWAFVFPDRFKGPCNMKSTWVGCLGCSLIILPSVPLVYDPLI